MKVFFLIVMFISTFLISNQNQIIDQDLHKEMILEAYKKNRIVC